MAVSESFSTFVNSKHINSSDMKKILLTLAVALVAAPGLLRAEALTAPVTVTTTAVTPVDELIKQMNKLFSLMGNDMSTDDMTLEQMNQFLQIAQEIENLKAKYSSYKLTAADRETLVRWARTTNEKLNGEKMTADEIAELREELNSYKTFGDLTDDLDLNDM